MAKRKRNFWASLAGRRIDLGLVTAEKDPNLLEYYVQPERYVHRALDMNDPAIFFIGAKGTGKSAVLQMVRLEKPREEGRLIEIAPDDLAFSALANIQAETPLLKESGRNQWLFKSLWDFVLSVEILRREEAAASLASKIKALIPWGEDREFKRLLNVALGDEGAPKCLTTTIVKLIKEVEIGVKADSFEGTATVSLDHGDRAVDKLPLLAQVNQVARNIAGHLRHPYYILIDDLDLHWSGSPTQSAFLAALFFSLRSISRPPNVKCVVAMRDDIYRVLPLEDKDKTRDNICYVQWDKASVKEIIDKRIRVRLNVRPEEVWTKLFNPEHFDLMWRYTTGKPREMIRLTTLCLQQALDQDHDAVEGNDIVAGIRAFSQERIEDLASELRHRYAGLDALMGRFRGFNREFDMARLETLAVQLAVDVSDGTKGGKQYTWAGGYMNDPQGLARILLECNVLQYKAHRKAQPAPYNPEQEFEITSDTWFALQPMYLPALGHEVK